QVVGGGLGVAGVAHPSDHLAGGDPVTFLQVGPDTDPVAVVGPGGVVVEVDVEGRPSVVVADVDPVPGYAGVSGAPGDDTVGGRHHRLQVRGEEVVAHVEAPSPVPGRTERRADVAGAEDREDQWVDERRVTRRLGRRRGGGGLGRRRGLRPRGGRRRCRGGGRLWHRRGGGLGRRRGRVALRGGRGRLFFVGRSRRRGFGRGGRVGGGARCGLRRRRGRRRRRGGGRLGHGRGGGLRRRGGRRFLREQVVDRRGRAHHRGGAFCRCHDPDTDGCQQQHRYDGECVYPAPHRPPVRLPDVPCKCARGELGKPLRR